MKSLVLVVMVIVVSNLGYANADLPLRTVNYVDVEQYMGTWYEIAKIPNQFQKKCLASRAIYNLKDNGTVEVINSCTTMKNKLKTSKGIAFVDDRETNSRLKVGFAPIFKYLGWFTGDYYIMELADDYSYVLVGSPSRDYLWILARENTLDQATYNELLDKALDQGFDIERVVKSPKFEL